MDLLQYQAGGEFKPHHDGAERKYTLVCYLNSLNEEEGGETEFPSLNLKVRPQKGCALFFHNRVNGSTEPDMRAVHAARTAKAVKYVSNLWLLDSLDGPLAKHSGAIPPPCCAVVAKK
jgi:prolyl 4-hydroxylase